MKTMAIRKLENYTPKCFWIIPYYTFGKNFQPMKWMCIGFDKVRYDTIVCI